MSLSLDQIDSAYDSFIRISAGKRLEHLQNVNLGFNGGKEATQLMKDLSNESQNGRSSIPSTDAEVLKRDVGRGI